MTEAIVWGVLWLVFTPLGAWIAFAIGAFGGVALATLTDRIWIAPVLAVVGWLGASAWAIFGVVHVVLQVIDVFQLAVAG